MHDIDKVKANAFFQPILIIRRLHLYLIVWALQEELPGLFEGILPLQLQLSEPFLWQQRSDGQGSIKPTVQRLLYTNSTVKASNEVVN